VLILDGLAAGEVFDCGRGRCLGGVRSLPEANGGVGCLRLGTGRRPRRGVRGGAGACSVDAAGWVASVAGAGAVSV